MNASASGETTSEGDSKMSSGQIVISDSTITITQLFIHRKDLVDYFKRVPDEQLVDAVISAMEVGTFCLERANAAQDLDFVRRQLDSLIGVIEKRVSAIPAELEGALLDRIGVSEGQVLAPIQTLVAQSVKATSDRLGDLRIMFNEIDPSKEGGVANRVVRNLRDLLDANRNDSVQATIGSAVKSLTSGDGALARTIQTTIETALKPLREELDSLAKEIRGQEAAVEALAQTTAKGKTFEEEIVAGLQPWARCVGAQVQHVGIDNHPGDIVVEVTEGLSTPTRIIIEAKDTQSPKGRKAITDMLTGAMAQRGANAAVYLSRDRQGLANEVGEWAEGKCGCGGYVACTYEHLITALRFLLVRRKLDEIRASHPDFDSEGVIAQIGRVRIALDRIKNINRKTSEIRGSAGDIETEAAALRTEVRDALTAIEEGIKTGREMAAMTVPLEQQDRHQLTPTA
jgi:hypothetical protein